MDAAGAANPAFRPTLRGKKMDQALCSELQQDLRDALNRMDTMLEEEEVRELEHVSEQFSYVMSLLVKLRNHLTQANREETHIPELPSLEEVNAMISVMARLNILASEYIGRASGK
jgi:hypothetical protein